MPKASRSVRVPLKVHAPPLFRRSEAMGHRTGRCARGCPPHDVLRLRAPALRARGTHAGRGLRRGAGGVSNRTTARGTAMTAIGCSAPRLATAVVERPLLYDALIAIADTGWRFDEQTNAGPLCRGASRGASGGGVSHDMSVPHVISGGGTVDLPGCGRPRGVASNPKVGEAGAHNPWKSRGRSLPLVPAVPAARFPQPHSASSSWASIIGNDPCTTRGTCDGQRGLEDYEGMTTHPEYTLAKPSTCLNNRDHFSLSPGEVEGPGAGRSRAGSEGAGR